MRTVVETEYSVDDVFQSLVTTKEMFQQKVALNTNARALKMNAERKTLSLFMIKELNACTSAQYRPLLIPWYVTFAVPQPITLATNLQESLQIRPLTDRDMLYIQDYVRVTGLNDKGESKRWFYTYNHNIDHPYFSSRPGFVRAKMKYQGMVGVVGDGGKTRLTWLANLDLGGMIPASFTTGLLMTLMTMPIEIVKDTKEYIMKQEGGVADVAKSSFAQEGMDHELADFSNKEAAIEELQRKLTRSERKRDELTASLVEKETELKRVIEEKDYELKHAVKVKDDELKRAIKEKDDELQEMNDQITKLRRRLPRGVQALEEV